MTRHKWQKVDDRFVCERCGIRKMNIWMGYGKNGKAAIYFPIEGDNETRTSYLPPCNTQLAKKLYPEYL